MSEPQRRVLEQRYALQLGISIDNWSRLRAARMDLAGLREAHRITVGHQATVRRTNQDGAWTFASTHPGHLRSQPQAFRIGQYAEPAWDLGTFKRRIARELAGVVHRFDVAPVECAARLVWAISRAQPFLGHNERLALLAVSRLLYTAGLPVLPILELERCVEFDECIMAANEDNRADLESYFANAIGREVLRLCEWMSIVPSQDARWSLRDEHATLSALRSGRTHMPNGHPFIEEAIRFLVADFETTLRSTLIPRSEILEPLQVARDATYRNCPLCPHLPLREWRWAIDRELELVIVIGAAGRGITNASSLHVSLELRGFVNPAPAAAFLLVADEEDGERQVRFAAWARSAIRHAVRVSPIRY